MADTNKVPGYISPSQQTELLLEEKRRCESMYQSKPKPNNGLYCNVTWDDLACWSYTKADSVATQPCPTYVYKFNQAENVTRQCLSDGTWYYNAQLNRTWSNYTHCYRDQDTNEYKNISDFTQFHLVHIRRMYNIGYAISLVSLVLAVVIMITFKRLHCARNTIHIHLFFSSIFRSIISLLRDNLLVEGFGFSTDIELGSAQRFIFLPNKNHWECKLFHSLFNYFILTNYTWILIEGLYLHLLIYVTMFNEQKGVRYFSVAGWVAPMSFVVVWVVVRLLHEDVFCWNIHKVEGYFWILKTPIVVSIVLNFFFFTSIIRVLFSKLAATPEARRYRYRKLARSTLVLIPLFGVHYIAFLWLPDRGISETAQICKLYFEMFFNSFQGFFVAVLFCFCNGEVRSELKKTWLRHQLRKHSYQSKCTTSTAMGRTRGDSLQSLSSLDARGAAAHNGRIPMINIDEERSAIDGNNHKGREHDELMKDEIRV